MTQAATQEPLPVTSVSARLQRVSHDSRMTRLPDHRAAAAGVVVAFAVLVSGCGGDQDTLDPGSHPEGKIAHLFWVMLAGAGIGFAVVVGLAPARLVAARSRRPTRGWRRAGGDETRRRRSASCVPIVVLVALFVWADIFVARATDGAGRPARRADGRCDRARLVVGGALSRHSRSDRERDPHPDAHTRRSRRDDRRRDPQLLGAGAEPEDRPDPRAQKPHPARRGPAGAISRASAPSSAACSTRTWRSSSSRSRAAQFEAWLANMARPAARRTSGRGARGVRDETARPATRSAARPHAATSGRT